MKNIGLIFIILVIGILAYYGFGGISKTQPERSPSEIKESPMAYQFPGILPNEKIQNKKAVIKTNKGIIEFELYADKAPKTVSNFVYLAEKGYYDGLTFHRVVPGFVIQGGDPIGSGSGGPGYQFEDEKVQGDYKAGTVAMANSGPDTNGSQFFICIEDQPTLPKQYNLFGQVISGMDVVGKIAIGDKMEKVTIESL
ncbi:MAG: ppiA [Candidatus Berkelbacteria bacterium]|nr:ppiA [Candidatus Berkelbacteria bacterium]